MVSTLSLPTLQHLLASIPRGYVVTYQELARGMGAPRAVRAVARLCGKNPEPGVYPCYKVVRSDGGVGGYSAEGGVAGKIHLLEAEGIRVRDGRVQDFAKHLHRFSLN